MEPEDGEGNAQSTTDKLKKLREELKKAKAERDEYLEALQRMRADYVNSRKRFDEERKGLTEQAIEHVITGLLPVVDALDEAVKHEKGAGGGLERIRSQLLKILSGYGIESFNPQGETFDPTRHESVETLATKKKAEDNIVTFVHQKGYSLKERVIRPARVAVGYYQDN